MSISNSDSLRTIGAFEAKTHLSQLLRDAEGGIETIITVRGKPVARLVPWRVPHAEEAPSEKERILAAIRRLRAMRAQEPAGEDSVADLIRMGRR